MVKIQPLLSLLLLSTTAHCIAVPAADVAEEHHIQDVKPADAKPTDAKPADVKPAEPPHVTSICKFEDHRLWYAYTIWGHEWPFNMNASTNYNAMEKAPGMLSRWKYKESNPTETGQDIKLKFSISYKGRPKHVEKALNALLGDKARGEGLVKCHKPHWDYEANNGGN